MELSTFITETLNALNKGIKDAQSFALENGAVVNPVNHSSKPYGESTVAINGVKGAREVSEVNFDIAVSVGKNSTNDMQGGINVYSIKLGATKNDTEKNETVSRIRFTVNVVFPASEPNDVSLQQ
jgi:hypothetical protein